MHIGSMGQVRILVEEVAVRAHRLKKLFDRLGTSVRGNVAIMAAAAVIPLLAMVGGAVDASRTYMAYTRLQQACDSGALAGRKAMANIKQLTTAEQAKANEFFDFNFPRDTYGAQAITRTFVKGSDGVVNGDASLSIPTTLMKMFGYGAIPLRVACQATLNIPNTDVMFVLDVTGSMAWTPSGNDTTDETKTRLYGLKQAVKDFYSALGPGAPSGPGRVRYGFVPYSSNVNVGRIVYQLNASYILGGTASETWKYPSRDLICNSPCFTTNDLEWRYYDRDIDTNPFVINSGEVANPASYYYRDGQYDDTPTKFAWSGCIQEARTVDSITATSALSVPSNADDLKIDLKPTSLDSKWKPDLTALMYRGRRDRVSGDSCPREAAALGQYATDYDPSTKRSPSFDSYVNSLVATGGTYHDIGLMWGARFLSASGIFSATNSDAVAPGGYQVSRHIVFMTDGELSTSSYWPDAWGINQLSGRIAPTWASNSRMDESHTRRTQIICNEMKSKGFTIWVVGFGTSGLSQTLKECASDSDHWSVASDTAALRRQFAKIAQTIGGLRLAS